MMKGPVTIVGFDPGGDEVPLAAPVAAGGYATLPFYAALRACSACTARGDARQVVGGAGPVEARILVIGQNPGEEERILHRRVVPSSVPAGGDDAALLEERDDRLQ